MASIKTYPSTWRYYVRFRYAGVQYKRSLGTACPHEAEAAKLRLANHPGGMHTFCTELAEPISVEHAKTCFNNAKKKSKWQNIRGYHVFRHSFASNLAASGVDERMIDEFMGHQTEEMRKRYRHFFPDQTQSVIESVFGGHSSKPRISIVG